MKVESPRKVGMCVRYVKLLVSEDALCYTRPDNASIFKMKMEVLHYSEILVNTCIDQKIASHPARVEPSATAPYSLKASRAEMQRYNLPVKPTLTYWDYGSVVDCCDFG
jgi:hypothetical protein